VAHPVFKTGRAGQPPAWKVRFLRRVVFLIAAFQPRSADWGPRVRRERVPNMSRDRRPICRDAAGHGSWGTSLSGRLRTGHARRWMRRGAGPCRAWSGPGPRCLTRRPSGCATRSTTGRSNGRAQRGQVPGDPPRDLQARDEGVGCSAEPSRRRRASSLPGIRRCGCVFARGGSLRSYRRGNILGGRPTGARPMGSTRSLRSCGTGALGSSNNSAIR